MKRTKNPTKTQEAIKIFQDYCTKKHMRYTPEREMIIKEIYRANGHFNVDKLFSRLRANNPRCHIAKTSIYRSVPYFLDAGLLRESVAEAGQIIYERTLGHHDHDHFRCVGCGKLVEFSSPDLISAQTKICEEKKFTVLWRMNVINGYCRDCRKRHASSKEKGSSAFAGDHPALGGVRGRRKNDGTASADSARKFSADEPGEAQSESIWAKTGHKRYHGHGRGAP